MEKRGFMYLDVSFWFCLLMGLGDIGMIHKDIADNKYGIVCLDIPLGIN